MRLTKKTFRKDSPFLYLAAKKINPRFYIRKLTFGRRTVLSPAPLFRRKKLVTALHWLAKAVRQRKEKNFPERLANELFDLFHNKGLTLKYKKEQEKIAHENKYNSKYLFQNK